jgi:hypothetical protein
MSEKSKPTQRLLYSREQVAEMLGGCSVSTIIRLEKKGKIKAVTLTGRDGSPKYFRHDDVMTLLDTLPAANAKAKRRKAA